MGSEMCIRDSLEGLVEGAAGRQHPKMLVEHEEGLDDRIDDRLRQRLRILDIRNGVEQGAKPIWRRFRPLSGFVLHHCRTGVAN